MKTSEVLKKKLGNISETVKEVNMTDVAFRCSVVRSVNPISFMRDDKCPRLLTSNDIKGIYIHCMC